MLVKEISEHGCCQKTTTGFVDAGTSPSFFFEFCADLFALVDWRVVLFPETISLSFWFPYNILLRKGQYRSQKQCSVTSVFHLHFKVMMIVMMTLKGAILDFFFYFLLLLRYR